jgi:hypothetical protein
MFRMWARRYGQRSVGTSGDEVLFGMSLPSDTVIHDITAKVQITALDNVTLLAKNVCAYALEMWLLPVLDPDGAVTYQTAVDTLVPKDTDVQAIDLDTSASDTGPFWEPGEADWSQVLDVGLRPERLWRTTRFLTLASPGVHIYQDNQSPFNKLWIPRMTERIKIRKRLRVRQPSMLVLALASPSMDDTTITEQASLVENEWSRVKYAGDMLVDAQKDLIGLAGSGGTPWEDATDLLQKHLMPDMYEETANNFAAVSYETFTEATIDHSVVGELGRGQLSLA